MRLLYMLLKPFAVRARSGLQSPTKVTQHEPWHTNGDPAKRPSATREDKKIILRPSGATFRIPQEWVEWHERFHNSLHLTREQLDAVARGDGEWDTEYASVSNTVLPFDRCCAYVGDEGWGRQGVSYGDLQVRIYRPRRCAQAVETRIKAEGVADIKRFSGMAPLLKQDLEAKWRRTALSL